MSLLPTTSVTTLKTAQLQSVYRMLAFNEDADSFADSDDFTLPPAGSSHNQWKILIYDTECRSIISPLLSVSQLRRRGVTLHLLLKSDREPIPDVPAVYFVRPTKENLAIIAQDCSKGLYGRVHLNFVTKLERSLMEDFAKVPSIFHSFRERKQMHPKVWYMLVVSYHDILHTPFLAQHSHPSVTHFFA